MPVKCRIPNAKTKVLLFVICVLCFDICHSVYAAPCYGTRLPEKKKIFLGLQSYSVFKSYLEKESGKLRSQQEFLLLSYGIYDWLSLDLKGGVGYLKQHPNVSNELDYPTFLGGGYGFRVKFFHRQNVKMVFGFQHISIHPHTISIANAKHKAVSDDWQFSLLASYCLKKTTPYLGTRWSRYDYIHWTDRDRDRVKSDLGRSIGLIVGCDFSISQKIWLNLEGQFLDRQALALSANYSF